MKANRQQVSLTYDSIPDVLIAPLFQTILFILVKGDVRVRICSDR